MPLSKKGKRILRRFVNKYGKEKGTTIFYSWQRKNVKEIVKT